MVWKKPIVPSAEASANRWIGRPLLRKLVTKCCQSRPLFAFHQRSEINLTNRQTLNKSETWCFFGSSSETFKLTKVLEKNLLLLCQSGRCFAATAVSLIQIFFPSAALSLHRCRRVAQRASLFHLCLYMM